MNRTRTYTWADPLESAAAARRLSGAEFFEAWQSGAIPPPPIAQTLVFDRLEVAEGRVSFYFTPQEFHYNPIGSVHGGVISTVLDSVLGCTVHYSLPAGMAYTSLDLKVNFLRPVSIATGQMHATGRIIHKGRSTALVEADLYDAAGKIYAHGVSSCLLFAV